MTCSNNLAVCTDGFRIKIPFTSSDVGKGNLRPLYVDPPEGSAVRTFTTKPEALYVKSVYRPHGCKPSTLFLFRRLFDRLLLNLYNFRFYGDNLHVLNSFRCIAARTRCTGDEHCGDHKRRHGCSHESFHPHPFGHKARLLIKIF